MSDDNSFTMLLPKLKELSDKEVREPDMPVNVAVSEGEKMAQLAEEDKAYFDKINFDHGIVINLRHAAGALRVADGRWLACWGEQKEAQKKWKENEPAGHEMRDTILAALSYGLRGNSQGMRTVRRIRKGDSHSDMIHDLRAGSELGKKYLAEMRKINYGKEQFDRCAELADELGSLYAKAYVADASSEALDTRNRAFTYMRNLEKEILEAARFVLRDDSDRLNRYFSDYRRKQYRSREEDESADSPTPQV